MGGLNQIRILLVGSEPVLIHFREMGIEPRKNQAVSLCFAHSRTATSRCLDSPGSSYKRPLLLLGAAALACSNRQSQTFAQFQAGSELDRKSGRGIHDLAR